MSTPNRAALLTKIHKSLKKHYKPAASHAEQPLLEALLFACCLENTHLETAEKVFQTIKTSFFDWNEVRVTTVKELSEVMAPLPDPVAAATHLKGILQSVFESEYSFDLEALKKQNIGQAVKRLQKAEGVTPFIVAYGTQTALGGHSIPLDRGALGALVVLGAASESEAASGNVTGLERAIPKSKGQEFGALLHELGADFTANPFSPALRDLLLSISPDAKDRFPKRGVKKVEPEPEPVKKKHEGKPVPAAQSPQPPATKKKETRAAEPPAKAAAASKKAAPPPKKKVPAKQPLAKRKPR
jgi:endonuclease-3